MLWGCLDPATDAVDMRLGLPAATLAQLGLRGLPPGYVLPLALGHHSLCPYLLPCPQPVSS